MTPRTAAGPFYLDRTEDVSGTSGIGRVAHGFVFDDGTAVLRWLTDHTSTAIYASLDEVEAIHGHDGRTKVVREAAAPLESALRALWGTRVHELNGDGSPCWCDPYPNNEGSEASHQEHCRAARAALKAGR